MVNRVASIKTIIAFAVIVLSFLWIYPNYTARYYAIDVSSTKPITQGFVNSLDIYLESEGIHTKDIINQTDKAVIVFDNKEEQLKANKKLVNFLGDSYKQNLRFFSYLPSIVSAAGGKPVNLGLDLQGGVQFTLEVDLATYVSRKAEALASELGNELRKQGVKAEITRANLNDILIIFSKTDEDKVRELINKYPQLDKSIEDGVAKVEFNPQILKQETLEVVRQNVVVLANRINELGVAESSVQIQGSDKILVELPGVQDVESAKRVIGSTANLEFRLEAEPGELNKTAFQLKDSEISTYLENDIILTGANINDAKSILGQTNQPEVSISVDSVGAKKMIDTSSKSIGRAMGIVLSSYYIDRAGKQRYESRVISLATINSTLSSQFVITGLDLQEANELALLLRSGTLSAPLFFVEEKLIGPGLGQENIQKGLLSIIIGFCLVVICMSVVYRIFGLLASFCLIVNVGLLMGILGLLGATLTLSGIAGILLTVGMAIDANVIIFSRMREFSKEANFTKQIEYGYEGAWNSIFDANLTTFLVAVIMFVIGTGPVKGFAITLSIGVITSLISSVFVSRALIFLCIGLLKNNKLRKYFL